MFSETTLASHEPVEYSSSADWSKIIKFAESNPEAFKCNPSRDGFRAFRMDKFVVRICEEDYLAICCGKRRPDHYAYVREDIEEELKRVSSEKERFCRTKLELKKGETQSVLKW